MALTFPAEARIMASSMWLDTPGRRSDPRTRSRARFTG